MNAAADDYAEADRQGGRNQNELHSVHGRQFTTLQCHQWLRLFRSTTTHSKNVAAAKPATMFLGLLLPLGAAETALSTHAFTSPGDSELASSDHRADAVAPFITAEETGGSVRGDKEAAASSA